MIPDEPRRSFTRRDVLGAALVGGFVLAGCGSSSNGAASSKTTAGGGTATSKRRGGTFRVGTSDASTADNIDAQGDLGTVTSQAIGRQMFEGLVGLDHEFNIKNVLAEEVTPSSNLQAWTIRLRPDLTFHNGKSVTADDVIYSIRRILNPKTVASGAVLFASVDPTRLTKMDNLTVRIGLRYPDAFFLNDLAPTCQAIVPIGYDPKAPVGTGPFKFKSYTSGQLFVGVRNGDYWQTGLPYLDQVELVGFTDPTVARVNALYSGQIDALDRLPYAQVPVIKSHAGLQTILSKTGAGDPIVMRCDQGVFSDNRVRTAFKLIADRPQLLQDVYSGYGRVANDLLGLTDPDYDTALPQRHQDLPQARALLKQAGMENLSVTFDTAPATSGLVSAAEVFAQQAKAAGVTIKVNVINDIAAFYAKYYAQATLKPEYYFSDPISTIVSYSQLPTSAYNTSHFHNQQVASLFKQAQAQRDPTTRRQLMQDLQVILHNESGWLVWGFRDNIDAYSTKFTGLGPDVTASGINGWDFSQVAIA